MGHGAPKNEPPYAFAGAMFRIAKSIERFADQFRVNTKCLCVEYGELSLRLLRGITRCCKWTQFDRPAAIVPKLSFGTMEYHATLLRESTDHLQFFVLAQTITPTPRMSGVRSPWPADFGPSTSKARTERPPQQKRVEVGCSLANY